MNPPDTPPLTARIDAAIQTALHRRLGMPPTLTVIVAELARDAVLRMLAAATDEEQLEAANQVAYKAAVAIDMATTLSQSQPLEAMIAGALRAAAPLLVGPLEAEVAGLREEIKRGHDAYADRDMEVMTLAGDVAALRQRLAEMEAEALRLAVHAVCSYCANGHTPRRTSLGWRHHFVGRDVDECQAGGIRDLLHPALPHDRAAGEPA